MADGTTDVYSLTARLETAEAEVRRLRGDLEAFCNQAAADAVELVTLREALGASERRNAALVELQSRYGIGAPALGPFGGGVE
jgi:hypothetical protein